MPGCGGQAVLLSALLGKQLVCSGADVRQLGWPPLLFQLGGAVQGGHGRVSDAGFLDRHVADFCRWPVAIHRRDQLVDGDEHVGADPARRQRRCDAAVRLVCSVDLQHAD